MPEPVISTVKLPFVTSAVEIYCTLALVGSFGQPLKHSTAITITNIIAVIIITFLFKNLFKIFPPSFKSLSLYLKNVYKMCIENQNLWKGMIFLSIGYLTVSTTAAQKIIPVGNTKITISPNGEADKSFMSDDSGKTPITQIDTPDISLSEAPGPDAIPFAVVNITAEKEGFFTTNINDVQIFPEITTTLYVNMVPIPEFRENTPLNIETIPQNL